MSKKLTPKPSGRPTKYKTSYPSEVEKHMGDGYTLTSWAGTIGVCRDTVYEWASKHPSFSYAISVGRAKGLLIWEKRLAKQATENGGNTASIIFAMKNMYVQDWADKIISELTGKDGAPIEMDITSLMTRIADKGTRLGRKD